MTLATEDDTSLQIKMRRAKRTAAELKRVCEATALLKIWWRHRTTDDDSLFEFAEWTMDNPEIVSVELAPEVSKTLAALPNVSDQEKINLLRAR